MAITVENWVVGADTRDINDATYEARLRTEDLPRTRTAGVDTVQRAGRFPVTPGFDKAPVQIPFRIEVKTISTANIETLMQWFRPGTVGSLQVDFDGTLREVEGRVRRIVPWQGAATIFGVVLDVMDPRWRKAAQTTTSKTGIAATGTTWTVTNAGTALADREVITVQPTTNKAAADANIYVVEAVVANVLRRAFSNYAFDFTNGGWDHATEVAAGRSRSDGNDVILLEDGIPIPHWFGAHADNNPDSALTTIWGNATRAPARIATLAVATTGAVPADGGALTVDKGHTDEFPASGFLLIEDEVIRYTGKTRTTFTGITRGARNTTAAIHALDAAAYWIEHRYQIIFGDTGAGAATSRDDLKPLLELTAATPGALSNVRHKWIDFTDDDNPNRSMAWARSLDAGRDGLSDVMTAPGGTPAAALTFNRQGGGAEAGLPNFNQWSRPVPSGTGADSGDLLTATFVVAQGLLLLVEGRDALGTLANLGKAASPVAEPTNPLYALTFHGRSDGVIMPPTGTETSGQYSTGTNTFGGSGCWDIQFTPETDIEVTSIAVKGKYASGSGSMTVGIYTDDGSDAPTSVLVGPGNINIAMGAADAWASTAYATAFVLRAGVKYWLRQRAAASAVTISTVGVATAYGSNLTRVAGAAVDDGKFPAFALLTTRNTDTPEAAARDGIYTVDGNTATVDGLTLHLDSAGVPYVALQARQGLYWLDGILTNNTTGQSVTFAIPCALNDVIEIDVDARTVRNLTTGESVFGLATFSDPAGWLHLEPGANTLQWEEDGVAGVTVTALHFDRWE